MHRTTSGGKRYALKDYPALKSKHSPTHNFDHVSTSSAYLSVWLSVCLHGTTPHLTISYHTNTTWKLCSDYLWFQTIFLPSQAWHSAGFGGVYFLGDGVEGGDDDGDGFGGQVMEPNENMSLRTH